MEKKKQEQKEPERKLVYWGYKSKSIRYDISHERFVVPWQMEHDRERELEVI